MVLHTRRALLGSLAAGVSLLAGCNGRNPARPARFSVTPTRTTRPANPEAPSLDHDDLQRRVDGDHRGSFVRAYDQRGLHFLVDPDSPVLRTVDDSELVLRFRARGYPTPERGGVVDETRVTVEPASDGRTGVTVPMDLGDAPQHRPLYYTVALLTGDESAHLETVHLHETDPFLPRAESESRITPVRSRVDEQFPGTAADGGGRRTSVEGAIRVAYPVGDRRVALSVPKSAYLLAEHYGFEALGRDELVSASVEDGVVPHLARSIVSQATADGVARTPRELVGRAVDVVQALPNGPDSVTGTYDRQRKSLAKTVVDLGGDSEDRSLLLAGILQTGQFGVDAIVVDFDGHAAIGVATGSATGYTYEVNGRAYAHVETTELGWEIGEVPEAHRDVPFEWYDI
ncbi:hypothetical protein [Haloarchaeobius sp. DT45]|uniref:hypothetical protein n=1 Tax=Haloarchaeobius sp. DT45 TaxID=3446116 RepID=UPI003F6CA46C